MRSSASRRESVPYERTEQVLTPDFLYRQNEFVLGFLYFVGLVAASELGFRFGKRRFLVASDAIGARKAEISTIQTVIFAVLGLLLAFTFSMVVSRYDARKQALVGEVNAIGTAYLRAELLPEPEQSVSLILWRRYADARLASAEPNWNLDTALQERTSSLQRQLWAQAVAAGKLDPRSTTTELYIESLNDAIDSQGTRDAARLNTLPASVLYLLFAVSFAGMVVHGDAAGLESDRSILAVVLLALILALIVVVIIDMDQPYSGLLTISEQGLQQLRQSMGNSP